MTRLHPDLAAPKAALRALIDACGGSEACSALLDGKSASLIRSYANPNVPERFMPLDDIWRLESFCGRAIVSEAGVRRIEDDPDRPRHRACITDLMTWIKEGGEAKAAFAALFAKPGQSPSAADRAKAVKELRELETLLADLRKGVEEGE